MIQTRASIAFIALLTASIVFAQDPKTSIKDFTKILDKDLTGWMNAGGKKFDGQKTVECKNGVGWLVEDGTLLRKAKGGGYVWSQERYSDFVLDLEVKTKGNSGIFFRTDNIKDPVQTGMELQILSTGGPEEKKGFGAIYDLQAPSKKVTCGFDDWQRITLTCKDNMISVAIGGEQVNEMDVNKWTEAKKNPDGTKNKFKRAIKDYVRDGHIGFQEHGADVQYRNIQIKRLK